MDLPSLTDTFAGLLLDEAATSEGECTEIVEWKTVLKKIMGELKKDSKLMDKLENMIKSDSGYLPFMGCLLRNDALKKILGEYVAKCKQQMEMGTVGKKNAAKGKSIRLQGNQLFVKREYRAAFKMFTRALMFAKDEDDETPILYANRSAVYFYMKQYENALEDIERAFKFGYGNLKPTGKLLIRKGFSWLGVGRDDLVKELLDANMPANENEPNFAQWQQLKKESENVNSKNTKQDFRRFLDRFFPDEPIDDVIKRDITLSQFQDVSTIRSALTTEGVFRPHERFPWLNAKVDLRYDAEKGYHLVSKEEMKYGEIVALSKPFVSLDSKRDSYERCHYCMGPCFETPKYFEKFEVSLDSRFMLDPLSYSVVRKGKLSSDSLRMATPLACPECSNVLYCSEACRTAAWTAYHRFECSQMAILTKMDSKAHLALRMLYMMGDKSFENGSPIRKLIKGCETAEDPLNWMVDQQAYTFVYSNLRPCSGTLEETLERSLTVCFLLKLMQMSGRLAMPSNLDERYIEEASCACLLLFRLYQAEVNETVPYVDPGLESTVSPLPILSVDGMKSMLKHSCEATVATSSLLTESLESNVKLLYATGAIPAGTQLTLAFDTEEIPHFESFNSRKLKLYQRYTIDCTCTRCVREKRDCLDISTGVYYPIGCSVCGELMVRGEEGDDDSYRCSSDGCTFKYSVGQMKNIYDRVNKMMQLERELSFVHSSFHSSSDDELLRQPYSTVQPRMAQLSAAIESTVHLLYGRSEFLARLYAFLAHCYLLISEHYSGPVLARFTPSTHRIHTTHLNAALLYTNKALDVLESMKKGPCAKGKISSLMEGVSYLIDIAVRQLFSENEPLLRVLHPQMEKAKGRYEALLKMTAFDTMVASSLAATIQE